MKKTVEKKEDSAERIISVGKTLEEHHKAISESKKTENIKEAKKKNSWSFVLIIFGVLCLVLFIFRAKIKVPTSLFKWKIEIVPAQNPVEKIENNAENQTGENTINQENTPTKTQEELDAEAQTDAKKWLEENAQNKVILENAKKEMGDDYVLVQYEYQQQLANFEWIDQQTAYPDIMKKAKKEWGDDYEMVRDMYEEEVAKKEEKK